MQPKTFTSIDQGEPKYTIDNFYLTLEQAVRNNIADLLFVPDSGVRSGFGNMFTDNVFPHLEAKDTLFIAKLLLKKRLKLSDKQIHDPNFISGEMIKGFCWEVSYNFGNKARFRASIYKSNGDFNISLRIIPLQIRSFEELNLPKQVATIANISSGLVLFTGETGQGKSTTIATILETLNQNEKWHIITLEDPIEFTFKHKGCTITQRELHIDVRSYEDGIKEALRQKAKVIMLGEIVTREQLDLALKAAQIGHLVLSTIHGYDVIAALDAISGFYQNDDRLNVRNSLSRTLRAIVGQRLIPTGLNNRSKDLIIPSVEILFNNTPHIAQFIAKGTYGDLKQQMEKSYEQKEDHPNYTMQTFDQHLFQLLQEGKIDKSTALEYATNVADIERQWQLLPTKIFAPDRNKKEKVEFNMKDYQD